MAASQDFGDLEMLGILAGICVAGYIGYKIYSDYANGPGAALNDISAAGGAVTDNVTGSSDPIVAGLENAWSALTDPSGDSMVGGATVTDSSGNTAAY